MFDHPLVFSSYFCQTMSGNNNETTPILGGTSVSTPSVLRAIEEGNDLDIINNTNWSRTLKIYGILRFLISSTALTIAGISIGKGYDYPCSSPLRGFLVFYMVINTVDFLYTMFIMVGSSDNFMLFTRQRLTSTLVSLILALAFTILAYKDDTDCNAYVIWGSRTIAPWELSKVLLKMVMMEYIFNDFDS